MSRRFRGRSTLTLRWSTTTPEIEEAPRDISGVRRERPGTHRDQWRVLAPWRRARPWPPSGQADVSHGDPRGVLTDDARLRTLPGDLGLSALAPVRVKKDVDFKDRVTDVLGEVTEVLPTLVGSVQAPAELARLLTQCATVRLIILRTISGAWNSSSSARSSHRSVPLAAAHVLVDPCGNRQAGARQVDRT